MPRMGSGPGTAVTSVAWAQLIVSPGPQTVALLSAIENPELVSIESYCLAAVKDIKLSYPNKITLPEGDTPKFVKRSPWLEAVAWMKEMASLCEPHHGIEPPLADVLNLAELSFLVPVNVVTS